MSTDVEAEDGQPTLRELAARLEELDRRGKELAEADAAFRILLTRLGVDPTENGCSIIDSAHAAVDRIGEIEALAEKAHSLAKNEAADQPRVGSKVKITKNTSRNMVVRDTLDRGRGAVDAPAVNNTVREVGPEEGVEARTVFDGWEDLVRDHPDVFTVQDGKPSPEGPNKRLAAR